ncbi:MAG: 6-hydroxymethylpterin diphosphokinase MptE-like protein [Luteolibacter sp.]
MRSYPWSVGLEPLRPGAWTLSLGTDSVTTTVPLSEWIGPINRPVTIVAGGPSARNHPMGELASGKRLVIAVNGVPAFLAEHGIRPDAWIVSDPRLATQIETNFPHAAGTPLATLANVAAAIAIRSPRELANRPLCLIERVNQWLGVRSLKDQQLLKLNECSGLPFLFPSRENLKSIIGWSRRPDLGFFSGSTVVFAALQIAVGLGARDIEIIGMDLSGQGHVYTEAEGALVTTVVMNYKKRILPSFEMMHEALSGTGVEVRNLSPVCPLPRRLFAT